MAFNVVFTTNGVSASAGVAESTSTGNGVNGVIQQGITIFESLIVKHFYMYIQWPFQV